MKYIGVDLGSSFIKAVLMDLDQGKIVDQDKMATPEKEPYKNPNYFEIPAKKIVEIVKQLVDHYTKEYSDIEGLIISTQMHGFVYAIPERRYVYILAGYAVYEQDVRCEKNISSVDGGTDYTARDGKPWSVFKTITWNL